MNIEKVAIYTFITAVALGLGGCDYQNKNQDRFLTPAPSAETPFNFPDSELGKILQRHTKLALGGSRNSEQLYQQSIEELRPKSAEASTLLLDSYKQVPENQYLARWLIVETLRELNSPNVLKGIYEIASTPIVKNTEMNEHSGLTEEETLIRVAAVEAIGKIAKRGNQIADSYLVEISNHDNLTIRRASIRAFLRAGDFSTRSKYLQKILSDASHYLISLETTVPTSVPYPKELLEEIEIPPTRGQNAPIVDSKQTGEKQ